MLPITLLSSLSRVARSGQEIAGSSFSGARLLAGLAVGSSLLLGSLHAAPAHALDQKEFNAMMDKYLQDPEAKAKLGDAVLDHARNKQQEEAEKRANAEKQRLEEQFDNPVDVEIGDSPVKGPKSAPVTVVEFSDFQCPYCSKGNQVMKDLAKAYPEKVKLVFKHLPLPFHPEAKPAAVASIAAQRQGKFWEMHDKLFENQGALGEELYVSLAKEIGLDVKKFQKDMKDPALAKQVEEDMALGTKLGIRGTPGYFVNGVQVRGAQPLPRFKELVDRWLEKKS